MNIRARWIVIFVVLLILAAVASKPDLIEDGQVHHQNVVGAVFLFIGALVALAVGIWDSSREDRPDPEEAPSYWAERGEREQIRREEREEREARIEREEARQDAT